MKETTFWLNPSDTRISKNRKNILELLDDSAQAIEKIERAGALFLAFSAAHKSCRETPKAVHTEAEKVLRAINTIVDFAADKGSGWATLKTNAYLFGGQQVHECLRLFSDVEAVALRMAAEKTVIDLKPARTGRQASHERAERLSFLSSIAEVAAEHGIDVVRSEGRFTELVGLVYESIGIDQKPDQDIRDYIKTKEPHGTGKTTKK